MDSAVTDAEADGGLEDWLSVAKASGQKKNKPQANAPPAKRAAAPAVPAGWMSSGKLGLPADDDDEDFAGKPSEGEGSAAAAAGASSRKKRKKARGSVSNASGPGGWLTSGALGVEPRGESDDDDDDAGDGQPTARGEGITIETQTEDDIEAVTKSGVVEKVGESKLPPWAKPHVPPPKTEKVEDTPAETEEAIATEKQVIEFGRALPLPTCDSRVGSGCRGCTLRRAHTTGGKLRSACIHAKRNI